MNTESDDERHGSAEALALDALDAGVRSEAEAHLVTCVACRERYAAAREVVALLAQGVPPVTPPAGLGARIVARALAERPARRPLAWRWLAAAAVILAVLGWNVTLQAQLVSQAQTTTALAAQLAAQATALSLLGQGTTVARPLVGSEMAPQARGVLYVEPQGTTALLVVRGLPPPPAGKVYQLWLIHDGQRVSGGLFTVDERGLGLLVVEAPQPLRSYQAVGITPEPAGGSPGPTGQRVIGGAL